MFISLIEAIVYTIFCVFFCVFQPPIVLECIYVCVSKHIFNCGLVGYIYIIIIIFFGVSTIVYMICSHSGHDLQGPNFTF